MLLTSQSPASEINPVETKCAFDQFFLLLLFFLLVCVCVVLFSIF